MEVLRVIRKVLTGAWLVLSVLACSQKKEEPMTIQNPEINAKNIVEKLSEQVKQYSHEPTYLISYNQNYCFFELLVNDIPVYKNFSTSRGSSAVEINHILLKSGIHKVTFRMYPISEIEKNNKNYNTLTRNAFLKLTVEFYDKMDSNDRFGTFVKKYETPKIPNPVPGESPDSIFVATGKEFYEGSFTFEAQVPYQLEGWSNSQDLRNLNSKELEKKVVQFYENSKNIFQNKNLDDVARLNYNGMLTQFISEYTDKEKISYGWEDLKETILNPTFIMQPIENYKMVFYANGKLVALEQNSMDPKYRGMSALWAKFKKGKTEMGYENYHMLHIPNGKTELEVAR